MSNIKKYIQQYWLFFIIITQPILDIIAFSAESLQFQNFTSIIRIIYLLFIPIYTFFNIKDKKKMFLCLLPFGIYIFAHLLNTFILDPNHIFYDIKYIVLVFQMPLITISLCFFLKEHNNYLIHVKKGFYVSLLIIFVSVILSIVTNSYEYTYEGYGLTGWFTSANTQSVIISIISPLSLLYFYKRSDKMYLLILMVIFLLLYFNGTRSCYYSLVITLIMFVYIHFIKSKSNIKLFATLLILFVSVFFYNFSFTSERHEDVESNTAENEKIVSVQDSEYANEYTKEEVISILKECYLYEMMIEDFGEEKVYNEMKDKITPYNLSDNRLVKRIYAKIIFKDSNTITKFLGFGHYEIAKYSMDIENDLTAIFYYYGYIGFALYIVFILGFAIYALVLLIKDKYMIFSSKFIVLSLTIVLALGVAEYSGALLRKPNANIYFALLLAYYFIFIRNSLKDEELITKKITFYVLHLGYGGIETATINTVNSLVNKYDIEIVSFYKLKNNQVDKINKKVKVKYLYNGEPNKEKFLEALKNHKYLTVLKEGLVSIDILIKKKLLLIDSLVRCNSKNIVSTRCEFSTMLSKYGKKNCIKMAQEHQHHHNNNKYIKKIKNNYKNIDYLCALTSSLKKDYEQFLTKNKYTKVILLPNMLENIPSSKSNLINKNIITVSRLDIGKRNNEIINILKKLNDKDVKLTIIGDGREYNNLKTQIKNLKLENQVTLTGYLPKDKIEKYMLNSSVFLMASISEGLPMVLLEAMSYGVPCIAYETDSGINDIIDDNINGFIVKNRNEKEYIKKLKLLLKDDDKRKKFGDNAKSKSLRFSNNEICKIWENILH